MSTQDTTTSRSGFSRRGALKLLGAGAAGMGALGFTTPAAAAQTAVAALPSAQDVKYWREVEKMFTLDKNILFMNVGTVGSPPKDVLDTVDAAQRRVAAGADAAYTDFAEARSVIAAGHGVDTDEIVITHNTTDGMSKVIAGLNLQQGDEVLTTNHEHSGGNTPLALAQHRYGIIINRVELPVGDSQTAEDYVELFRGAITTKTKLIMFSAPTYVTGTMLPIRMLADLAQSYGIPTLVDGAHIPGMMAYNFRDLGVDFLAGSAAKWQCGPGGTGVLYIRNRVSMANPTPLPEFWPVVSSGYPTDGSSDLRLRQAGQDIGSYLQTVGNGTTALNEGVQKVSEIWDGIGRQRIQDYSVGLADYLKEQVTERWGVTALYSPTTDKRLTCALTSFNPFQNVTDVKDAAKSTEVVTRLLQDYGIEIRSASVVVAGESTTHNPLRVSTHLFHQREDVDRLIEATWKISTAMA